MKTLFLTAVLAFSLSAAAQEEPQVTKISELTSCKIESVNKINFEEYLIGEGLFGNAFFKPTIFMEGIYFDLDEKLPFQHTQRGAIYTNDFLTYMPR